MTEKKCGPHAEIAKNESLRLTQCPCGSYHLHLAKRGVSIQLGGEELRQVAEAFDVALRVADAEERGRSLPSRPSN